MWQLFLLVISLDVVSFGGAQILLAGLERELVQTGLMGQPEFAAAVALGQSTPGPLAAFTTAVGMAMHGLPGALVATGALIVVSQAVVWLIQQVPSRWLEHPSIRAGLSGLAPTTLALVTFLALRMLIDGGAPSLLGIAIIGGVLIGKLIKVQTGYLLFGAILATMLLR